MKKSLKYASLILLFILFSCTDGGDSQVSGGKFTVHFTDPKDKDLAKDIVRFWKANKLMTDKKQDVKLIPTEIGYDLLLISPTRKKFEELSFEELKSLNLLRAQLQNNVFKTKELSLVIADDQFKPLFRPNFN